MVARPDPKWGETPCAFVTLKDGMTATADELIEAGVVQEILGDDPAGAAGVAR